MLEIRIPGRGDFAFHNLLLDVNGTLALDGTLLQGVEERLAELGRTLRVLLITADTHGGAAAIRDRLGVGTRIIDREGEDTRKQALVRELGGTATIAIGNGRNDALMLEEAGLGIAVLGPEGSAQAALARADVIAPDILVALDLLRHPQRLVATLRS